MRILSIVDWLPPDFGAVGQYALEHARQLAAQGHEVTLVGLSSTSASESREVIGSGSLTVRRTLRPSYDKSNWLVRGAWTLISNLKLLWCARRELRTTDELQFSGAPPYMVLFAAPLGLLFRRRMRYRVTDLHPECLMAALARVPWWLRALHGISRFWRRRIDAIEVLGNDQRRRLREQGIAEDRIVLRRDPSPVGFPANLGAAEAPAALSGRRIILYSGNWGVAHDHATFVEGFARFCAQHGEVAGVWLNATGKRADVVEAELRSRGLPCARTQPCALAKLPSVLLAADVHLVTLHDAFVGYVLPSKVYACIASGRPILFVGSADSDVHALCLEQVPPQRYRRVEVGDVAGIAAALTELLPDAGRVGAGRVAANGA